MDQLLHRRSCRRFISDEAIPREHLERIVKTAQNYACSMGHQEVDFLVITNREKINKMSEGVYNLCPEFRSYLDQRKKNNHVSEVVWCDAPCVIFGIYNDESKQSSSRSRSETNCGIAIMNVIAESESLGYSTLPVLMASNEPQNKAVSEVLGIPVERLGLSVAIGRSHPDWKPDPKQDIQRVHFI